MVYFGEYLRQQRLSHGFTMQELAERLEVSPQFISLLESRKRHPSKKLVRRTAALFDEDLKYLEFLAQPIPEAQKRALFESPAAPDYIPQSLRTRVLVQDSDDALLQNLLTAAGLPKPIEDTPYHFAGEVDVDPADLAFPRQLIEQIRRDGARFASKAQAWADFYEAFFQRHLEGRSQTRELFERLDERMSAQTDQAYPQLLRFLTSIHLGLCQETDNDLSAARSSYETAHERAAGMKEPAAQACALWLIASVDERQSDILVAVQSLEKALKIEGIPPFAIARCRSSAIQIHLDLWDNEKVIEGAEETIKLWRSSTLDAPQDSKSLELIRMEIAAFEAALRLGRADEAQNWLSRVRSMRVRIELPNVEAAHLAVVTGTQLAARERFTQATRHPETALALDLPHDDVGNSLRLACHRLLARIAIDELRFRDAERILITAERIPLPTQLAKRVWHEVESSLLRATARQAARDDAGMEAEFELAEAAIRRAVDEDPRLDNTPLIPHMNEAVRRWREDSTPE